MYLSWSESCLQLSALLLQGSNLFVFGEQCISMLGQVTSSLAGKSSFVLLHSSRSDERRRIHLD